ncbi:MAG: rRNA maturation RNase YbeY [Caldiserica bacterium CG02_land_8_20_14_3_00_36_38]|nr:rRNA maturation RNase YbeY [Caldisericota bacterium]PIP49527.1 MAG: rRNA maturation RNase YbeY [Caldiserica bacterium CG23_combo_of_CG06-09_8_20_14_all_35_60]PIV56856.1 MAG: rRNA maturation RNase YbeY [Caldiserica bacterium CG02_land_8_20_14_3_00_36_38]PIW09994.1 MAG: rRNA maturation RNase YbeY [Caldiserica bacterium CG17_big_fil_post_rev_8_21_14_2_50_35_7]PIX28898.1 MAG: rRNA maturation RNase YbeY [Caldiserica bacterium CG_4_8_14_3_um_filter_35_18]
MEKKIKVSIVNETKRYTIVKKNLEGFIEGLTKFLKINKNVELSIAFIGTKTITKINKKFRNVDKATDVISFNLSKNKSPPDSIEGEIIICPLIAEKEAKKHLNNFPDYIEFLIIHGFLHILGYNHDIEKDRAKMESLEEKTFKNLKVKSFITKEVLK